LKEGSIKFDAIKLTDIVDRDCNDSPATPGSDIDAVCALSSISVISSSEQNNRNSTVSIFPNPTSKWLNLANIDTRYSLSIHTIHGQEIHKEINSKEFIIDVSK